MKLLLDTHAVLWFLTGHTSLSAKARAAMEDRENERWISMAGLWEIAVKVGLGKLELNVPFPMFLQVLRLHRIEILEIRAEHVTAVSRLPPYHRDPFDRMMAVQSAVEAMPLVSVDPMFDRYGVRRIW
jgi:PIN domain nuclease of toxin-antitoxin system